MKTILCLLVAIRIVSYNVENFYHPSHDTLTNDLEWTQDGERHWSFIRYNHKAENIAKVITNIGEWDGVDIVGLCEVENKACLKKLCYLLSRDAYDFVHYDSPDQRGIDVGLLYRRERFDTLSSRPISVDLGELSTRDILYVCLCSRTVEIPKDTFHLFLCHFPSQLGGSADTEWKRVAARTVLQNAIDSVLALQSQAKIIVMGDMNSTPKQDLRGVENRMIDLQKSGVGSHKWQGRWTCLDQFYTSPSLCEASEVRIFSPEWILETDEKYLGLKPKRCYVGFRYQKGYSDHLPVVLTINQ